MVAIFLLPRQPPVQQQQQQQQQPPSSNVQSVPANPQVIAANAQPAPVQSQ